MQTGETLQRSVEADTSSPTTLNDLPSPYSPKDTVCALDGEVQDEFRTQYPTYAPVADQSSVSPTPVASAGDTSRPQRHRHPTKRILNLD